jgi:hypothetical protein
VDIVSFPDAAPEVQKEVIPDTVEPPVTATDTAVPQSVHPHDEASPEFTKELELTIHRGEDPVQDAPLLEIRKKVPEVQAPSPSLAAFNKSFGTSHRGELLSVGFEAASIGDGTSKILHSGNRLHLLMKQKKESRNKRLTCLEMPFGILGRSLAVPRSELLQVRDRCSSLRIKKGSLLFTTLFILHLSTLFLRLYFAIFQSLKIFFDRFLHPSLPYNTGILRRRPLYLQESPANV